MKRIIAVLLLASLILIGCTAKEPQAAQVPTMTRAESEPTVSETTVPRPDMLASGEDENSFVGVEALMPDGPMDLSLMLWLENRSEDESYLFTVSWAEINGLLMQTHFSATLEPRTRSQEQLFFLEPGSWEPGEATRIRLCFEVMKAEDLESVAEHTLTVYPKGEEQLSLYERQGQEGDTAIIESVVTQVDRHSDGTRVLYFQNTSDKTLLVFVEQPEATEETTEATTQATTEATTAATGETTQATEDVENMTTLLALTLPADSRAYRSVCPDTPFTVRVLDAENMDELHKETDIP